MSHQVKGFGIVNARNAALGGVTTSHSVYCLAMATLTRSSGFNSVVEAVVADVDSYPGDVAGEMVVGGPVIGGCRIRSQPTFVGLAGGYCY